MACTCDKCGKQMDDKNFYTYKNGDKTELCKSCLTMHIDNFDESTFLWLLEKMDVPYIPGEWNTLRDKAYAKDPYKMNGMSVFGKYLAKMRLKQWKQYGWEDTEMLQEKHCQKIMQDREDREEYEQSLKDQLDRGEINESQYKTLTSTARQHAEMSMMAPPPQNMVPVFYDENKFISEEELIDPAGELTQEDKVYLAMKWGRLYKPDEWISLEKNYNEMMNSFDIQDADTINTLVLLCKINLKMNQAIDCGDIDGALKSSRMYDSLRKSAKFTAAQNKEQKNDFVDSVGELVAMCERQGFIPRYATDIPQDKVDVTLKDMNAYIKKLVTQDLGFGQQIEDSIKKLQIQKEMREQDDGFAFEDEEDDGLRDQDYAEFYEDVEEQKQKDMKVVYGEE
ncbi:MAG: hypothetical protein J6V44_17985 [Methanobrevibacter sp.]|nr:hypothetical protein [Methanobrevibacter sp.]